MSVKALLQVACAVLLRAQAPAAAGTAMFRNHTLDFRRPEGADRLFAWNA